MKHYGLDLKVAFKHKIMQQSVEFVCGFCCAKYLTAKTLFVLIPSHFQSYFFSHFHLTSLIPLPSPQVLIEAVILFMTNLFNGGLFCLYESQEGGRKRGKSHLLKRVVDFQFIKSSRSSN